MKFVIVDSNNVSNIAFYQAKNIMLREKSTKMREAKKEGKSEDEIKELEEHLDHNVTENLKSFSINIFLNMIHKYFKENRDSTFLFVWDGRRGSAWRKEENPDYKSNRDHSHEIHYKIFIESMQEEREILKEYPVIQFQDIEAEADDLIYNLCDEFKNDDVKVISGDSDFIQLPQKFGKTKVWNPRTKKYYKIPEYDYVTYKAIVGDNSDCIEGLYKFGPKKAEKTISNNLENLSEEQLSIVDNNKKIIDLSLNPFVEKNKEIIHQVLSDSKISLSLENIKKIFFKLKLKAFLLKWDNIVEILKQLKKESIYGEKEC